MMDDSIIFMAAFFLFGAVSIGVILILWIAMPFSVFGVKALLKKAIDEQAETNRLLRSLIDSRRGEGAQVRAQEPSSPDGTEPRDGID